jgi:hypothetical protein
MQQRWVMIAFCLLSGTALAQSQPPLNGGGASSTILQLNGQAGFLAGRFQFDGRQYTLNVDNIHAPGDEYEQNLALQSEYGGQTSNVPGLKTYSNSVMPVSALLKIHRFRNVTPWSPDLVTPGKDYATVEQLFDRANNPLIDTLNLKHKKDRDKPIDVLLKKPTPAMTLPTQPLPQQHSSALPSANGCTSMACCADLERQYNAALAPIPRAPTWEAQKEAIANAAPIERQLQACRRQANGLPPISVAPLPPAYPPYHAYPGVRR